MKNLFVRHRESRYVSLLDWAALLGGIVLFTALSLPTLLNASAYFDEGYSAYLAQFNPLTIAAYTALDVHPPLYYTLLHFWQNIVGLDVAKLRMLSVVFAWVAIVFGWLIARRWFGRPATWVAPLLMALSPLFIRYGGVMRMYTLALAIAFAGTYVLLRAVHSKGRKWWAAYAVLVAAGMWTNYFMALVWVTHLAWLLYIYRKETSIMQSWRWSFLWALVLYITWLPMLLFRYGEIQLSGFWIKPLSLETLVSTITQSIVFQSAAETKTWIAIGVITFVIAIVLTGRQVYKQLDKDKKPVFQLIMAMSSLPVILLTLGSLPPLRSSYVYRYVLVASTSAAVLTAIIIAYAKFPKNHTISRAGLYALTVLLLGYGAGNVMVSGNRNLDTNSQNMLSSVMNDIHSSGHQAPVVVRSPYTYYVARMYTAPDYNVYFVYSSSLEKVGSTKPLYDHPETSIVNFDGLNHVWIVGEDARSVAPPQGNWVKKDFYNHYDNETNKLVAAGAYYERITK